MGIVSKQTLSVQSNSWKWQTKGCTLKTCFIPRVPQTEELLHGKFPIHCRGPRSSGDQNLYGCLTRLTLR
jgi:hypothetical protein